MSKGKRAKKETSPEAATHFLPPELNANVSCHFRDAQECAVPLLPFFMPHYHLITHPQSPPD
jgi:hypothetical protein